MRYIAQSARSRPKPLQGIGTFKMRMHSGYGKGLLCA